MGTSIFDAEVYQENAFRSFLVDRLHRRQTRYLRLPDLGRHPEPSFAFEVDEVLLAMAKLGYLGFSVKTTAYWNNRSYL